jgi:ABC-type phosphate/phosphonate transport system substrate-binding protein
MRRIGLAAMLAATVIVAGCSSSEAPSEESSTQSPAPNGHGAYASCLHENGVSAPPGPVAGPPPGTDEATWKKAEKACASLAPGPDAP